MAGPRDRSPRLPPPDVRRAIDLQHTADMRKEAKRYAEWWIPMMKSVGVPIPRRFAEELVHDAITATMLGESDPWDPDSCTLLMHVRGLIKKRSCKEIRHRTRVKRVEIGPDTETDVERSLRDAHGSVGDVSPILLCGLVRSVCTELRTIAPEDRDAASMLECWENGFVEKREVMMLTGFDDEQYKRVRDRILSRRHSLPSHLVRAAHRVFDRSA
jgi:hypothetical protein